MTMKKQVIESLRGRTPRAATLFYATHAEASSFCSDDLPDSDSERLGVAINAALDLFADEAKDAPLEYLVDAATEVFFENVIAEGSGPMLRVV
jgi:hypothetical protein